MPRPRLAVGLASATVVAAIPLAVSAHQNLLDGLTFVLVACALAGVLGAANWEGVEVSASFVCFMLAAVFLGPAAVFAIVIATEIGAWIVLSRGWIKRRYRARVLPINLASIAVPALLAAHAFDALAGEMNGSAHDLAALAAVEIGFLALNFVLLRSLLALLDGYHLSTVLEPPRALLPSLALTVALTLAIVGVYTELGI
ncbi:MAG: hypothetical protein ACRDMZ_17030, partial [Solirubrobacteraceae bacterium]